MKFRHKYGGRIVEPAPKGFIDFPRGVKSTPCKTHTHRAIDPDTRHGMDIYHLTYGSTECSGNLCQGKNRNRKYIAYTIVR